MISLIFYDLPFKNLRSRIPNTFSLCHNNLLLLISFSYFFLCKIVRPHLLRKTHFLFSHSAFHVRTCLLAFADEFKQCLPASTHKAFVSVYSERLIPSTKSHSTQPTCQHKPRTQLMYPCKFKLLPLCG